MSERIVYDCDGVGCESMAEDTIPSDWLMVVPAGNERDGVQLGGYVRHFCSIACLARWAETEAHLAELRVDDKPSMAWNASSLQDALPTIGQGGMSVRAYFHRQNTTQQDG